MVKLLSLVDILWITCY